MNAPARTLLALACLVVIVAGLKAIASFALPLVFAILLTVAAYPLVRLLESWRVPRALAVLLVVFLAALGLLALGGLVAGSVRSFSQTLPTYEAQLRTLFSETLLTLRVDESTLELKKLVDPGAVMRYASAALNAVMDLAGNLLVVLLMLTFLLLEASGFRTKLLAAFGKERADGPMAEIGDKVQRYLGLKTVISLITGVLICAYDFALGLDFALLWGLLAFLLNYIPTVGSVIAAVPAVMLALLQLGPGPAIAIAVGHMAVNLVLGSVVEPRVMGQSLGLSAFVVFVALLFWGFVWGIGGMLLSVPMMVVLKIALEANESTRPIAILLGPEKAARIVVEEAGT